MRYARRLVQLLEADLARDRARIVELNATIETLLAERNDREAAEKRLPIIPAAVAELADREEIEGLYREKLTLIAELDGALARIAELETERDELTDIRADLLSENTELIAERDKLLAERDEYPSHHAAYKSGRRAVLQAMRTAVNNIEPASGTGTVVALIKETPVYSPEDVVDYIDEALDIEEGQTE